LDFSLPGRTIKPQPELLYSISGWTEKEINHTRVAFQEVLKHLPFLMSFAKDFFNKLIYFPASGVGLRLMAQSN
jgi:hypothetical protein